MSDLDEIWTFIAEADQPPTVAEVASALGMSNNTTRRRLKKLRKEGRAESLKVRRGPSRSKSGWHTVTTWRALLIAAEGIAIPVTLISKPSQIPAGSALPGSGDNQEVAVASTCMPVSSPAAPESGYFQNTDKLKINFYDEDPQTSDEPIIESFRKLSDLIKGEPVTSRAITIHMIELSGFAAFEVPADGLWRTFAEFAVYRAAERTRYRIASLGYTPPGIGPKQAGIIGLTGRRYRVRVRAMPARQPPSKARGLGTSANTVE